MLEVENYQIRYIQLNEADKLQTFIDQIWKKDHVLGKNKRLLDYQHKNEKDGRYNFVVACNTDTGDFDIVLGFIPHSQYDIDTVNRHIWLAIWKKTDKKTPRGLGKKLLDFLEEDYKPDSIGSIGINDSIEQLYLSRGWISGVLDLWYFAKLPDLISYYQVEPENIEYYTNEFSKSDSYYKNRYEEHPFYSYSSYQGVIYRKITTPKGNCLRIVDFKKKYYLDGYSLNKLLIAEDAGYIDCLNHGLPSDCLMKMGFQKRSSDMLIPQWFEPFDSGVRDIKFAYKSPAKYFIVKGDSDQDRPNMLPG